MDTEFGTVLINEGVSAQTIEIFEDKIIVGGWEDGEDFHQSYLKRLNPDGTTDLTFGSNGYAIFNFATTNVYSTCVYLGSLYVLCQTVEGSEISVTHIVKYDLNGNIDLTFGQNGKISIPDIRGYNFAMQTDGKIIIAGVKITGLFQSVPTIYRLNQDGSLDMTFGTAGETLIPALGGSLYKIILDQQNNVYSSGTNGICKLNPQGQPDTTFANNGILKTSTFLFKDIYSIAITSNNKIVAAGMFETDYSTYNVDVAVYRFNTNGSIDTTFGINGKTIVDFNNYVSKSFGMAVQGDGKVVIAAFVNYYQQNIYYGGLTRVLQNGGIDVSFGNNGIIQISEPTTNVTYATRLQLQSDGAIIVCGSTNNQAFLQRYLSGDSLGTVDFSKGNDTYIYPNPLTEASVLEYTLANVENISVELIDVNGRVLKTYINNQEQPAGLYRQQLNTGDLPSGTYFITLTSAKGKITVKAIK